jgi:hypothetical protein
MLFQNKSHNEKKVDPFKVVNLFVPIQKKYNILQLCHSVPTSVSSSRENSCYFDRLNDPIPSIFITYLVPVAEIQVVKYMAF